MGSGNLRTAVHDHFTRDYPDFVESLTPHNQFLYVAAGTGLVGLLLFLFAFYAPCFLHQAYRNALVLAFYAMVTTTFLLEHTIENSVGTAWVTFFLTLFLSVHQGSTRD